MEDLRIQKAVRGGAFVLANQIAGMAIAALTAFLISRAIGPHTFAVLALCSSMSTVTQPLSRLGINAFLITRDYAPTDEEYQVALTSMLCGSIATGIVTISLLPIIQWIAHTSGLFWPGVATMALLPLHVLSLPAVTRLERELNYRALTRIEFMAQLFGPGIGIILVLAGWGIWGMIIGWFARSLLGTIAPWIVIRTRPQFGWNPSLARSMFKYGSQYLVSSTFDQSRHLIVLLAVGRTLGQEAVGHFEVALRAIRLITPIRAVAGRVALPAMAPITGSNPSIRAATEPIIETEVLLTIPFTLLAVYAYPLCAHLILGKAWLPTISIVPWLAAGAILAAPHACALSLLHLKGHFRESISANLLTVSVLALTAFTLGHLFGLIGCAASQIAIWPTLWLREWMVWRRFGNQSSRNGIIWALGGACACFAVLYGGWFLLPIAFISKETFPSILNRVKSIVKFENDSLASDAITELS